MPLIALDTETTGSDFYHGARPFLVTICNDAGENGCWEWPVDPKTRKPIIPEDDLRQIADLILDPNNELVLHNARFDCAAINSIMSHLSPQEGWWSEAPPTGGWWPWNRTQCTLMATHLLGSALPHSLDKVALQYLRYRKMEGYEKRVEVAVKKARDYARRNLPDWKIAKAGDPNMPSLKKGGAKDKDGQAKDSGWKNDMWLLRAIVDYEHHPDEQLDTIERFRNDWFPTYDKKGDPVPTGEGDGLCADYANLDSSVTHRVWPVIKAELHRRNLWEIYKERMKLLPIAYRMERCGLTLSETRLTELMNRYSKGVEDSNETCLRIAREMGYPLTMPNGSANNQSLKTFFFGEATVSCSVCKKRIVVNRTEAARQRGKSGTCNFCKKQSQAVVREWPWLDLPVLKETDTGQPALDKDVFDQYLNGEELNETQREFIGALQASRSQGKAIEALKGYQSFWLPIPGVSRHNPVTGETELLWKLIHPNLNPTGSDTLRWTCRNPNLQNISKKKEFNLRFPFGPAPGREHWSFDFRNIELRLPAYESGQQELIDLFERMNEPPFYGSEHLLNFSVIYPDIWERELPEQMKNPEHIKTKFKDTNYQWIKNTDFGLQYECGDAKADATAHAKGVKKRLQQRFTLKAAMSRYWINFANKHGYVETMPDRTVNPNKGYPLMTQRTNKFGRDQVSPTIPLAYRVSGTAMWLTARAMVRCQEQLDVWNRECGIPDHYRMCLQVHDELFFDWPREADPKKNPRRSNLSRARIIQRLMEECGTYLVCKRAHSDHTVVTVPTPVSVEYHPVSWDVGIAV